MTEKETIEKADFTNLTWKLEGVDVSIQRVLSMDGFRENGFFHVYFTFYLVVEYSLTPRWNVNFPITVCNRMLNFIICFIGELVYELD